METFSTLLIHCEGNPLVTGGFPSQMLVMQTFDVFLDLHLNKRVSKIEMQVIWDAITLIVVSL